MDEFREEGKMSRRQRRDVAQDTPVLGYRQEEYARAVAQAQYRPPRLVTALAAAGGKRAATVFVAFSFAALIAGAAFSGTARAQDGDKPATPALAAQRTVVDVEPVRLQEARQAGAVALAATQRKQDNAGLSLASLVSSTPFVGLADALFSGIGGEDLAARIVKDTVGAGGGSAGGQNLTSSARDADSPRPKAEKDDILAKIPGGDLIRPLLGDDGYALTPKTPEKTLEDRPVGFTTGKPSPDGGATSDAGNDSLFDSGGPSTQETRSETDPSGTTGPVDGSEPSGTSTLPVSQPVSNSPESGALEPTSGPTSSGTDPAAPGPAPESTPAPDNSGGAQDEASPGYYDGNGTANGTGNGVGGEDQDYGRDSGQDSGGGFGANKNVQDAVDRYVETGDDTGVTKAVQDQLGGDSSEETPPRTPGGAPPDGASPDSGHPDQAEGPEDSEDSGEVAQTDPTADPASERLSDQTSEDRSSAEQPPAEDTPTDPGTKWSPDAAPDASTPTPQEAPRDPAADNEQQGKDDPSPEPAKAPKPTDNGGTPAPPRHKPQSDPPATTESSKPRNDATGHDGQNDKGTQAEPRPAPEDPIQRLKRSDGGTLDVKKSDSTPENMASPEQTTPTPDKGNDNKDDAKGHNQADPPHQTKQATDHPQTDGPSQIEHPQNNDGGSKELHIEKTANVQKTSGSSEGTPSPLAVTVQPAPLGGQEDKPGSAKDSAENPADGPARNPVWPSDAQAEESPEKDSSKDSSRSTQEASKRGVPVPSVPSVEEPRMRVRPEGGDYVVEKVLPGRKLERVAKGHFSFEQGMAIGVEAGAIKPEKVHFSKVLVSRAKRIVQTAIAGGSKPAETLTPTPVQPPAPTPTAQAAAPAPRPETQASAPQPAAVTNQPAGPSPAGVAGPSPTSHQPPSGYSEAPQSVQQAPAGQAQQLAAQSVVQTAVQPAVAQEQVVQEQVVQQAPSVQQQALAQQAAAAEQAAQQAAAEQVAAEQAAVQQQAPLQQNVEPVQQVPTQQLPPPPQVPTQQLEPAPQVATTAAPVPQVQEAPAPAPVPAPAPASQPAVQQQAVTQTSPEGATNQVSVTSSSGSGGGGGGR